MVLEILLLALVALVTFAFWKQRRPKNFPPGPFALPLIGNLHNLSPEPSKDFMRMSETYGDVISVYFGPYPTVVLNSASAIREAMAEVAFSGRPRFQVLLDRTGGKPGGVIFQDGIDWVDQRRFILKNLRDFGFGKKSMEGLVQEEVKELIETFKESADAGTPISTQNKFNAAVLNALWSLVSGQRYSHSDPILGQLIKQLTTSISQSKVMSLALFFPVLRKIVPRFLMGGSNPKERAEQTKRTMDWMKGTIKAHQDTLQEDAPRDFIDVYLTEVKKTANNKSSFFESEGERNLLGVINDLFVAGAETTSTTLTWEFLLLALYPEKQEKLFEEIKEVVGLSRLPSLSDKPLMPYTEAVISEVMRFGAIIPMAVMHRATEDTTFRGFHIPKDTLISPNLFGVMHDPKVWGDPDNFRPERFLTPDGSKVIRCDDLIPFGTGRRVCLGESLARDELFLFTTSLFQRFQVKPDPNSPPLKVDYYAAPVLIPKPHQLILINRQE